MQTHTGAYDILPTIVELAGLPHKVMMHPQDGTSLVSRYAAKSAGKHGGGQKRRTRAVQVGLGLGVGLELS